MKRGDLLRHLRKYGCHLKREGRAHSLWINPSTGAVEAVLWAALDCTSGLAVLPVPEGKAIVLGELCARIDRRVAPGDKCIAVGWPIQVDGRKRLSGSAIFSESGLPVAIGRAVWIEVPESAFLPSHARNQ